MSQTFTDDGTLVAIKPWMKQPGELHDMNGVPIYPGDLLRTFHFQGRKRRKYYLYHTAVYRDGAMHMVPTAHLQPTKIKDGGACLMNDDSAVNCEVIHGYGPKPYIDYLDRPKKEVRRG